ncbi:MAG: hypothetical protein LKJ17_11735 [Oscillospiraceae bacterium]|jgi:hypothetical protein|nr:hypothetical protein [Oscillospiraceae bacterium]
MKGIIVEIKGIHAAALSDEGCMIKVRNKNYEIGQVIEMRKPGKAIALAAVAAGFLLMFGVSAWAYATPYTYVSLDVNPSVEYSVNRIGRVLSAKAVDQDAVKILEPLQLQNQSIDDAVRKTVQQIDREGYFQSDDPGGIVITTCSQDEQDAESLAADLQDTAEQEAGDSTAPVKVESFRVGYERVQRARTLGTTPGKLNLVEKLQSSAEDPHSIDVQTWLKKPVKDIMKAIQQTRKDSVAAEKQTNLEQTKPGEYTAKEDLPAVSQEESVNAEAFAATSQVTQQKKSRQSSQEKLPKRSNASNKGKKNPPMEQSPSDKNTKKRLSSSSSAVKNAENSIKGKDDSVDNKKEVTLTSSQSAGGKSDKENHKEKPDAGHKQNSHSNGNNKK